MNGTSDRGGEGEVGDPRPIGMDLRILKGPMPFGIEFVFPLFLFKVGIFKP